MTFFASFDAVLSQDEQAIVDRARAFCAGQFAREVHTAYLEHRAFDPAMIDDWAKLGMLGLMVDKSQGGFGASFACKVRVAQEMATKSFAAAFAINNLQGTVARIARDGSDLQQRNLLPDMMTGSLLSAPAMSEPQAGSDLPAIETVATRVSGGWKLNGRKRWITNGTISGMFSVMAKVDDGNGPNGIGTFAVLDPELNQVSRTALPLPGAMNFRLADLLLDDFVLPEWAMLQPPGEGFKTSLQAINAARVHVAGMAVATLYAGLTEAVEYTSGRLAFGKPVIEQQGLSWQLAEVATRLEAAQALVIHAARSIDNMRNVVTLAAQAKVFAVETAIWGLERCLSAMGAIGATQAHRITMHLSEVRLGGFGDGTSQILTDRIGRELQKTYSSNSRQGAKT
ncbi:acyl-CoA dehydrogenase family protein [Paracoccus saliphilus]|uniref:Acyl-CoA/acyl-ACP dehydrogenase n=1 Tax=Paracoccus saliphilus TaxID=405559 RepID=A0AA45W2M1_9RHOB|nr:acyl-CoA dehydrogenase family protein [Paracoccus saliphilus]WCR01465.1 acyl-CoA/acyl-ACP dehydrogenase [Paracoccus saliphilus]SIS69125.1 hypothetical protein SAMN05421772_10319 [Paracoccus saliphilus]